MFLFLFSNPAGSSSNVATQYWIDDSSKDAKKDQSEPIFVDKNNPMPESISLPHDVLRGIARHSEQYPKNYGVRNLKKHGKPEYDHLRLDKILPNDITLNYDPNDYMG